MKQIVKVVFIDGETLEKTDFNPFVDSVDRKEKFLNARLFNRQFVDFEKSILRNLRDETIKDFVEYHFDYHSEDDCDCDCEKSKQIEDYSDDCIITELFSRKIFGSFNRNILTEDFLVRFSKIVEKENQITIDNLLSDLETKLNIV